MTQEEQQLAFGEDLDALCDRYISEFNLTLTSVIGALEIKKLSIFDEELRFFKEMQKDSEDSN